MGRGEGWEVQPVGQVQVMGGGEEGWEVQPVGQVQVMGGSEERWEVQTVETMWQVQGGKAGQGTTGNARDAWLLPIGCSLARLAPFGTNQLLTRKLVKVQASC
jgi:hypothetical protein